MTGDNHQSCTNYYKHYMHWNERGHLRCELCVNDFKWYFLCLRDSQLLECNRWGNHSIVEALKKSSI